MITQDSREIVTGDTFVALVGEAADGHIFINKADNAADVATPRDLGLSGAEAFLVVGTPSADREKIKIQIVSIGATTFTFRINGVVVGTPEAGNSTVTNISWIAEG